MIFDKPICFFDTETTGTDVATDRIVEICILKWFPDGSQDIRTKRINPGIPIPASSSEVHGITDDAVKDCPAFRQVAKGIIEFIGGCDIGGFNSNTFDVPMLYAEFNRAGIVWDYSGVRFFDAGNIFKRKEQRTLAAALKFFCGKELENAHSAEADIVATKDVFFAQLTKYSDLPDSAAKLAEYCNYDKPMVDLTNRFSRDADGDIIFNFGKHKGRKAKDDLPYCQWILGAGFPPDATEIAREILIKNQKTR